MVRGERQRKLYQVSDGRGQNRPVQARVDGVLSVLDSQHSSPCVGRKEKSIHIIVLINSVTLI